MGVSVDNYFGSLTPSSNVDLTALLPGLGALAGLGAASGASRLPVTNLSVFGGLAGGFGRGIQAQQHARIQEQQAEMGGLQLGLLRRKLGWMFGGEPAPGEASSSGGQPASSASGSGASQVASASGGAPIPSGGESATVGGASTPAGASTPIPGFEGRGIPDNALRSAAFYDLMIPGAGKDWLSKQFPGPTDFMRAVNDYNNAAPNLKPYALASLQHQFGDRFQLMRNGWAFDKLSGQWFHMPSLGEGVTASVDQNGNMSAHVVPGAIPAIGAVSTAEASGTAHFHPFTTYDQFGNEIIRPTIDLAGGAPGGVGAPGGPTPRAFKAATAPVSPVTGYPAGTTVGRAIAASDQGNNGAAPSAATPPASAQPAMPSLATATLGDVIPRGSALPARPAAPAGAFLGAPNPGTADIQKEDADRLASYNKQAAEGQKIYQDVGMLSGVLQRGLNTNNLAPLWSDMTNVAQGLGLPGVIPKDYDPNDAAVFNKVATDLTFAALKQLPGQPRVAEIEGLQKANPNMVLPPAANAEILHAILANQQWMDKRSDLATQYMTVHPGAPLGYFDARFNQKFPLTDATNEVFSAARASGWKLPGDKGMPSNPAPSPTAFASDKNAQMVKQHYLAGLYGKVGSPEAKAAAEQAYEAMTAK